MIIDPVLIITISYYCKVFNFWTTISSYIYNRRGGKAGGSRGCGDKTAARGWIPDRRVVHAVLNFSEAA